MFCSTNDYLDYIENYIQNEKKYINYSILISKEVKTYSYFLIGDFMSKILFDPNIPFYIPYNQQVYYAVSR